MPVLLGSRETQIGSWTGDIDLTDLIEDFWDENKAIKLVGVRKIPLKKYVSLFKKNRINVPKTISPLEFSVLIYDQNGFQRNQIQPHFYYIEISPFTMQACTVDNSQIDLKEFKGVYYGVISPRTEGLKENIGEKVMEVHQHYLLPNISRVPYYDNFISRKELFDEIGEICMLREKVNTPKNYVKYLNAVNLFWRKINGLFQSEDITKYEKVKMSRLPQQHRNYPLFTFKELRGPSYFDNAFSNPLYKLALYSFGSDKAMRERLTNQTLRNIHKIQGMVFCCTAGLITSLPFHLNDKLFVPSVVAGGMIAVTGIDFLFRMYKNMYNHSKSNSGIIGSIYERIVE